MKGPPVGQPATRRAYSKSRECPKIPIGMQGNAFSPPLAQSSKSSLRCEWEDDIVGVACSGKMSMSVQEILDEVQKVGGNLRLVGSKLRIRAPRGALNVELKSKIDLLRDELTEHLRQAGEETADSLSTFVKVPRPSRLPLSFAQEQLWFLDQLQPGGSEYNMTALRRFRGAFDVRIFERAIAEVISRHEVLRTRFENISGEAHQVIDPPGGFALETEDLSSIAGESDGAQVRQRVLEVIRDEGARPCDLEHGSLFRVRVLRLADDDHLALVVVHHAICDGWSLRILDAELDSIFAALSRQKPCPLPGLSVQYADYALWQRQRLQGATLEGQLAYWRRKLAAAPPLQLPTDRARPIRQSFNGANASLSLPTELLTSLEQLASRERATLFMVLLAAFKVVLARWSGQDDVVVGTPVAGRTRREFEGLIGFSSIRWRCGRIYRATRPFASCCRASRRQRSKHTSTRKSHSRSSSPSCSRPGSCRGIPFFRFCSTRKISTPPARMRVQQRSPRKFVMRGSIH